MKKFLSVVLMLGLLLGLAACSNNDQSQGGEVAPPQGETTPENEAAPEGESGWTTVREGVLILATNAEFPPFEYLEGSEIVGFDIDLAQEIAKELGLELEIENIDFDAVVETVKSGRADVAIAGLTVNAARLNEVNFSNPYHNSNQMIIVPIGSEIAVGEDLDGLRVGVQTGTTGELEMMIAEDYSVDLQSYPKPGDAIMDLTLGRLEAVVIDINPAQVFVSQNSDSIMLVDEPLTDEDYAIGINKDNPGLVEAINAVLAEMEADGRMESLKEKYGLQEAEAE